MRSWWTWLAICLVATLAVFFGTHQPGQPTTAQKQIATTREAEDAQKRQYGVAVGAALTNATPAHRAKYLAQIKKAGFDEVRLTVQWPKVEYVQGKYDWSTSDALLAAAKKAGLSMIVLIDRAPAWARADSCKSDAVCAPKNATDYATFAAAAASRYKSYNINAWEVWNEQNNNLFWQPNPDPQAYTALLTAAYTAIKKADPTAIVISGGMSGDSVDKLGVKMQDPRTFLSNMYAAGVAGSFDGIGYHPYIAGGGLPNKDSLYNGWSKMDNGADSIRSQMIAHGDGDKSLWLTEMGLPTGGTGTVLTDPANPPKNSSHVTYQAQEQIGEALFDDLDGMPWVRNLDWYTLSDGQNAATVTGASFGLYELNGKAKPILSVIQSRSRAE